MKRQEWEQRRRGQSSITKPSFREFEELPWVMMFSFRIFLKLFHLYTYRIPNKMLGKALLHSNPVQPFLRFATNSKPGRRLNISRKSFPSPDLTITLPGSSSVTTAVIFAGKSLKTSFISFSIRVDRDKKAGLVLFLISSLHVKLLILS